MTSKKIYIFSMVFSFFLVGQLPAQASSISILSWGDFIDPGVVKAFEKKYKVRVSITPFESDQDRDAILLESQGHGYDIIVVDGITIHSYAKANLLAPLNKNNIPNLKYINPSWFSHFPSTPEYAVPYFWCVIGIAYRTDLYPKQITSWLDLFTPNIPLSGRIQMPPSADDLISIAFKSLGHSINDPSAENIEAAYRLLIKQKNHVYTYQDVGLDAKSTLHTGEAIAAVAYNGDIAALQDANENIAFVVPKEGGLLCVDSMVISAYSSNKTLAEHFLNFINAPENAAQNSEYSYYPTPNTAAKELIDDEVLSNKTIYPDVIGIKRSTPNPVHSFKIRSVVDAIANEIMMQ